MSRRVDGRENGQAPILVHHDGKVFVVESIPPDALGAAVDRHGKIGQP